MGLLTEMGFDAWVWQPEGCPSWFRSPSRVITQLSEDAIRPDDILVFPEVIGFPEFAPLLRTARPCTKLLFCQNQYYVFNEMIPRTTFAALGFRDVFASSLACKGMLERVLHLDSVAVVPYDINHALFRPREKKLQIAVVPRKMPQIASTIGFIFKAKYPEIRHIPFIVADNFTEEQLAEALGTSHILLALNQMESLGLVPLEAMASGCVITGFHGYGGLEYANPQTGLWHAPDQLEEVADSLYRLVKGLERDEPWVASLRKEGHETALRYNEETTRKALVEYYGRLNVSPAG
ncbi:hypothetical protein amb3633 [Paramagnetospirillum magneticum AMB-1]|uniref:Glycosyl transferase family 1 domain-containing protein n=1 Tax=Paramagnetospirillum magneticum (strain ATCC 700264 / AMB-1) TaxID=342108 RepID=Q2W138_PARM1|nr:hypothetical protein amb3633 [Paramagnetospirillum magneticum AMB-1]